jgi:hypothetical protein
MTVAANSPFVSKRPGNDLPQHNADILGGVVAIDPQVADRLNLQIQMGMAGQQRQHMIEKTDPGADVGTAAALQGQGDSYFSFLRFSAHFCLAHAFVLLFASIRPT